MLFFSLKKIYFKSEEGTAKRGGFSVLALLASQNHIFLHCRSIRLEVFLEIWQNSLEKACGRVSFSIKLQALLKKRLVQVLSCQICQISKNTFSYRTPPMAVSDTGIFENSFLFYGQS